MTYASDGWNPVSQTTGDVTTPVRWWPVSVAMAGMFIAILDSFIVIVTGPVIGADLALSEDALQWTLAAYQLAFAVLLVIGGRLADANGRRRMFCVGVAVFTLASVACALANGAGTLIVARVVQGAGAALMVPQVFALIVVLVPEDQRPRVFGVLGVVIGLATIGGQVIGGVLVAADLLGTGWRAVFWINVPIGLVTIALARRLVPESRVAGARSLDLAGAAVLAVALLLLVGSLIEGQQRAWPWWTWASLVSAPVLLGVFVGVERRVSNTGRDPLLAPALWRERAFVDGLLLVLCVYALLTSYYLALSVSLQRGLGLSALEAGLVYAPAALVFLVFGLIAGRAIPRYGRRVLELGATVLAAGYLATAALLLLGPSMRASTLIPTLMLQSVGGGLLITPSLAAVLRRVAPTHVGMASGALSTAQQVGAALGVAVVGAVFFGAFDPGRDGSVAAAGHAFGVTSLVTAALSVVALALVRRLPRS